MESDLSSEVINDLLNLLKDPKLEVKKGTLCVILQFCTESIHRQHFENTDIIKTLLRNMNENVLKTNKNTLKLFYFLLIGLGNNQFKQFN